MMKTLGKFQQYIPDPVTSPDLIKTLSASKAKVLFFKNQDNKDWLDFRNENGRADAVDDQKKVVSVSSDITMLSPDNLTIFVLADGEAIPELGWILDEDGSFSPPKVETQDAFEPLTRFQFEVILELLGITQDKVFTLIDALPWTDMKKIIAKTKVRTGGNDGRWSRENDLWDLLGPSLGITTNQIDEKWLEAQAL